jgi:hypothetical protein
MRGALDCADFVSLGGTAGEEEGNSECDPSHGVHSVGNAGVAII